MEQGRKMIVDIAFHPIGTSGSLIEKSPDF
jgi:hypothetical protein